MMKVDLLLPIKGIPTAKTPFETDLTTTSKEFVQSLKTMMEQAKFACPWNSATVTSRRCKKVFLCNLSACHDGYPGCQCHANQQAFHMLAVCYLSLLPMPTIGFIVPKQSLNGVTTRINVYESVIRPQVTNQAKWSLVSLFPVCHYTHRTPTRFLKALPRILARYSCFGVKSLTLRQRPLTVWHRVVLTTRTT